MAALLALNLGADQAEEGSRPLDPKSRAIMLMAILGILILGMIVMVVIVIGAHRVRRLARSRLGASRMQEDAWYAKPLVDSHDEEPAEDDRHEGESDENDRAEPES